MVLCRSMNAGSVMGTLIGGVDTKTRPAVIELV